MESPAPLVGALAAEIFGDVNGIGLDLVDVQVLLDLIEDGGQPFLDACWTEAEQSDADHDTESLAGRWAAKEAVMKCLGAGLGEVEPTDIEVLTRASGAPVVRLSAGAAAIAQSMRLERWLVSITHEGGWAAAVAVVHRYTGSLHKSLPAEPNGEDRHA